MTLTALLITREDESSDAFDLQGMIELEKNHRTNVLLLDMMLDGKPRRWLDDDLTRNWESL